LYVHADVSVRKEVEQLMAERALAQGDAFTLKGFMDELHAAGLIPMALIRWELTRDKEELLQMLEAN